MENNVFCGDLLTYLTMINPANARLNNRFEETNVTKEEFTSQDETRFKTYVGLACGAILLILTKSTVFVFLVYRYDDILLWYHTLYNMGTTLH